MPTKETTLANISNNNTDKVEFSYLVKVVKIQRAYRRFREVKKNALMNTGQNNNTLSIKSQTKSSKIINNQKKRDFRFWVIIIMIIMETKLMV